MASNVLITLDNVSRVKAHVSPVIRSRVIGHNSVCRYRLYADLDIQLSTGIIVHIPAGFEWDLSSVPRWMWSLFPPDGDFEIATMLHDYLYITKIYDRAFSDLEMYLWSVAASGTQQPFSARNLDNLLRYLGVRLGGWIVWYKIASLKDLFYFIIGKPDKIKNHGN